MDHHMAHAQIEQWLSLLPGVLVSTVTTVEGQDTICIGHDARLTEATGEQIRDRLSGYHVLFLPKG
jgi:hypothetical protein